MAESDDPAHIGDGADPRRAGRARQERAALGAVTRRFLAPHRWSVLTVMVLTVASAAAALYVPTLNARLIDDGVARGDTGYILRVGGLMLLVTLAQSTAAVAIVYAGARAATGFGHDLRRAVYARVNRFSDHEFAEFGTASLITRTTNDVQQLQMLIMIGATVLVTAPIMAVGGVFMALRENARMSLVLVVTVPLLLAVVALIMARMIPKYRQMQARLDGINRSLREQLSGIPVIRAFVREDHERGRFDIANRGLTDVALSVGRLNALMMPAIMLISNLTSVAVLWFAGTLIDAGEMQVGQMTAFLAYIMQILSSVMMVVVMAVLVPRAAVSAERVDQVLRSRPTVRAPRRPVVPPLVMGSVDLRGVGFGYPGARSPVLTGVTFSVEPGTTTAIVGGTGAGKTTLLSLIPRLYDVGSGSVRVDGVDVRDQDLDALCSGMGLVPQRTYLFAGTVASNLAFGNPGATEDQMWEALRVAQAEEFLTRAGTGLATQIAQGGTNLSGGQRQRLAIARALVRRPSLYLFDDAFSALDAGTEAALHTAFAKYRGDSTVITVSQRIARIADADQIVVLESGRVVGVGTHRRLLAECETYRQIADSQQPLEASR